jgi:periplasmic divalent cation tolerance protein
MSTAASGELLLVLCTFPNSEDAAGAAERLVSEGLVACVNLLRDVRSIYFWAGEIVNATEVLCLLKTRADRFDELAARLRELHPYEVPEIVAVKPSAVNEPYLNWVISETSKR